MNRCTRCGALFAALTIAACGGGDAPAEDAREEWVSETTVEGNVTTVSTVSGSVWGAPARLEETLSIGVDAGEEAYMFGRLRGVSGVGDRIYVLDATIPAVRVYDDSGNHLMDIGSEGDGPGEFRRPDTFLVAPDGRVFVRDAGQGRITVFAADGSLIETYSLNQGGIVFSGPPLVMTVDGTLYTPGRVGEMPENTSFGSGVAIVRPQMGMLPIGPEGTSGEPVVRPENDYEAPTFQQILRNGDNVMVSMRGVPFAPGEPWAMAPSGAMVAGVATDYVFDIIYPGGDITRVRRDYEPVPLAGAERDWHIEQITAQMRAGDPEWTWDGPEMATVKPPYDQLLPDLSGRVWVGRLGAGIENPECEKDPETGVWDPPCWGSERLYDVFDLEGAYLGSVDVPEGFTLTSQSWMSGDELVASVEDEMGVITVKKYRLVLPASVR